MKVRQLTVYELKEASKILNEVYSKEVFSSMQYEEEIALLRSQMTEEALWIEKSKRKITIWGALESDKIQGVGVIDQNGTIIFEAIKPESRSKGFGKELTRVMKESVGIFDFSSDIPKVDLPKTEMSTMEVPTTEVPTIEVTKTEFTDATYPKEEVLKAKLNTVFTQGPRTKYQPATVKKEKRVIQPKGIKYSFIFPIAVLIIIMATSIVNMSNKVGTEPSIPNIKNINPLDNLTTFNQLNLDLDDDQADDENIDEIFTQYIADNLSYEVDNERIYIDENDEKSTTFFNISYPQISFKDGKDSEKINEILRNAACTHYDMMYPVLSESLANSKLIDENHPYLKSDVEYEVTYMSNDIICVAYSEHYFLGSVYAEYCDLRVRIINLHTYEQYKIEDILNCDTEFAKYYYDKLVEEHESFQKATLLTPELLYTTLHGEIAQGRYFNNVIIDAEGVYIGFTYHYGDGNLIMRGWEYTHIDDSKLKECKNNDEFWNMIKY